MDDAATRADGDRFCESCGYNLRGLANTRCPECGTEFDPDALPTANIPWLRRSQIGAWRAYWQTVFAVMLHPIRFAEGTADAVLLRAEDAVRFRRVITWQGAISIGVAAGVAGAVLPSSGPEPLPAVALGGTFGLGSLVFLAVSSTILPMMTFRGHDEARLRVLQRYSAAPLATLPAIAIFFSAGIIFNPFASATIILLTLTPLLAAWWWLTVCILGAVERYRLAPLFDLAISTLLAWVCSLLFAIFAGTLSACVLWRAFV